MGSLCCETQNHLLNSLMKIAVIGAQRSGKSTLIKEICRRWPMYARPATTYRDMVAEKGLPLYEQGTVESQTAIRDFLTDEVTKYSDQKYIVYDRCILDNLAYTLYHAGNGVQGFDEAYMRQTCAITSATVKLFDVIFFCPINKQVESKLILPDDTDRVNGRSVDDEYRESINEIFEAIYQANMQRQGFIFDPNDSPPVIRLEGSLDDRLYEISMYIDEQGNCHDVGLDISSEAQKIAAEKRSNVIMPASKIPTRKGKRKGHK